MITDALLQLVYDTSCSAMRCTATSTDDAVWYVVCGMWYVVAIGYIIQVAYTRCASYRIQGITVSAPCRV
jgi:hypothetical protein